MNEFYYPDGATPLTHDELHDLIPGYITTQAELNVAEQMNVARGLLWLNRQRANSKSILTEQFTRELHQALFGHVWQWAGRFRNTDKNIGVYWLHIATELKKLLDDINYQIAHDTYSIDEIALRFHHRLVLIHPFPNGNGRHSRIMTDGLLTALGHRTFSWGGGDIQNYQAHNAVRKAYISALRAADKGDYTPLKTFVRQPST